MKSNQLLILFLFLLILIPISYAEKVTVEQGVFDSGLVIKYPIVTVLKIHEDRTFNFHIFNQSNGYGFKSGINCTFHLYNQTGNHIFETWSTTFSEIYDIQFKIDAGNFSSIGFYAYTLQCERIGKQLGGFVDVQLEVTETGIPVESKVNNNFYLVIILGLSLMVLGLVLIGDKLQLFFIEYKHKVSESQTETIRVFIDKYICYIVASWLSLPLLNITIILNEIYALQLTNTLNGVYKGVMYLLITITTLAVLFIIIYMFNKFNEYITER